MRKADSSLLGRAAAAFAVVALFAGCGVSKQQEGDSEKVTIASPLGGLKVKTNIDPKDVGLGVYPGARLKPSEDSNRDKSANVNMDTPFFKLKVVALDYLSDDAPEKVLAFYKQDMSRYGKVVECKGSKYQSGSSVSVSDDDFKLKLNCDNESGDRNSTELKAGEGSKQHIVGITPSGTGTEFGLVFIELHGGKEGSAN